MAKSRNRNFSHSTSRKRREQREMEYFETLSGVRQGFAETLADPKSNFQPDTSRVSSATIESVTSMLDSPESNYAQIASLMAALKRKSGTVERNFKYFESHLTFNHTIFASMNEKSGYSMEGMPPDEFLECANFIDRFNIRFMAPYFLDSVFTNGMSFFYKIQNTKGVSYMEFPISWGRISSLKDGVYLWMLDISKVKEDILPFLPNEIVRAYEQYAAGSVSSEDKKWFDNKWYRLSDKGIAFCLDPYVIQNGGIAISPFASLLIDSISLDRAKNLVDVRDELDTIRILHSKIPTDKDGKPTMSAPVARKYDQQMNRSLPDGIVGVTNPMDVQNIPLNGAGNTKAYDSVSKAQSQLFMTTGTPPSLFGMDTKSSNVIKMAVRKDAAWLFNTVLPVFENYYNYELRKFKSDRGLVWRLKFLRQSYFTMDDDTKLLKDQVTMGGSRLDYLASTGMEPIEMYNKLTMEQQLLDIDALMVPKQTSYTMSSKDGVGAGRPAASAPTDDTDRINDAS